MMGNILTGTKWSRGPSLGCTRIHPHLTHITSVFII